MSVGVFKNGYAIAISTLLLMIVSAFALGSNAYAANGGSGITTPNQSTLSTSGGICQGGQSETYDPSGLFTSINASGVRIICINEGQCDASGKPNNKYYGVIGRNGEPANHDSGKLNLGWCSCYPDSYNKCANGVAAADKYCYKKAQEALVEAKKKFKEVGLEYNDRKHAALLIAFVDAYNQGVDIAIGERGYSGLLKTLKGYGGFPNYTPKQVEDARTSVCQNVCDPISVPLRNILSHGRTRVRQIFNAIDGCNLALGPAADPSYVAAAELAITLRESVGNLECWSCGIIVAITRVADGLGNEIFEVLRGSLIALLAAMLGIYLV
jgi:hypothetical protein